MQWCLAFDLCPMLEVYKGYTVIVVIYAGGLPVYKICDFFV